MLVDFASLCRASANSSRSKSGASSSRSMNGMAATAHDDDRMPYQGVDGVLAFRNSDGQIELETPGSRRKLTAGAQNASGWFA